MVIITSDPSIIKPFNVRRFVTDKSKVDSTPMVSRVEIAPLNVDNLKVVPRVNEAFSGLSTEYCSIHKSCYGHLPAGSQGRVGLPTICANETLVTSDERGKLNRQFLSGSITFNQYYTNLIGVTLNLLKTHPNMLVKRDPPAFSENDYLRVVWSSFFELMFPASDPIKIKTGETTFYRSAENKALLYAHLPSTSNIVGFKIDIRRLLLRHKNRDIDICAGEIASHDGDNKIIDDEGKLNREAKDILDHLISIIPQSKSSVSMGWSVQIAGSSCFFSAIHLNANGLYVKVSKFQASIHSIADTIEKSIAIKHSVGTAVERAKNNDQGLNPRIYWIRDSYYTSPSHAKPALTTYLFGCTPHPSILNKLLSLSHEVTESRDPDSLYKDSVFDENGWTFTGQHWYNSITKEKSTTSPYEESDHEEMVTTTSDNKQISIPNSDAFLSEFDACCS